VSKGANGTLEIIDDEDDDVEMSAPKEDNHLPTKRKSESGGEDLGRKRQRFD